jgi:predicted nucleic acid-binding protein
VDAYFLDSSALVKAYINEQGSNWTKNLIDPASTNKIYVSLLSGVEVISAITRRANRGDISASDAANADSLFRKEFSMNFAIIDISRSLVDHAMDIANKFGLRGYDATQLAVALMVRHERSVAGLLTPVFVSSDNALNSAAKNEGFAADDPNLH